MDKKQAEAFKRAVEEESRGGGRNLDYHDLKEIGRAIVEHGVW